MNTNDNPSGQRPRQFGAATLLDHPPSTITNLIEAVQQGVSGLLVVSISLLLSGFIWSFVSVKKHGLVCINGRIKSSEQSVLNVVSNLKGFPLQCGYFFRV